MPSTTIRRETIDSPTLTQWREQIERDLKGAPFERRLVHHTPEGIAIQPLYTQEDGRNNKDSGGFPGSHSRLRGEHAGGNASGWEIVALIDESDIVKATNQAKREVANGATGLLFGASSAACKDGFWVPFLRQIDPRSTVLSLPTAAPAELPLQAILSACSESGARADELAIFGGVDPLGSLATHGWLAKDCWAQLAEFLQTSWNAGANSRCLRVDDRPYHYAGASEAQSIGFTIAAAIDTMRALEQEGVSPTLAAQQLEFFVHLDCEFFTGIAKLRALRRLWSQVRAHCNIEVPLRIHTRTSPRVVSQRTLG